MDKEILKLRKEVHQFCLWLTRNNEMAKDLSQETLYRAYRYIDYYQEGTNLKAWLFRIAKNIYINEYNKTKNTPMQFDLDQAFNVSSDDYKQLNDLYLDDALQYALSKLENDKRQIFMLKYVEEYKYEEIAQIYEMSLGTVKSWLHRIKKELSENITQYKIHKEYSIAS